MLESDEISTFESMAQQLCEQKEPIQVVSELLAITYGKELDKNRYGNITKIESPSEKNRSRGRGNGRNFSERDDFAPNSNQVRLYVQLGRMDGHNVRSIADYFSKLLNIPQHFVDKIDLSEKFTLVNLPRQAGMDLLNRSKKDNSLPHMHIDVKVGGKSGRGGDKFGRSTDFGGDNFRGERGFSDKKKSGFQGKNFLIKSMTFAKILKQNVRYQEVPISYNGRSFSEGKKIGWKDGIHAILALIKFRFTD